MRAYWVGFFVACAACDGPPAEVPAPSPTTIAQKIEPPATRVWSSTFADVPLKQVREWLREKEAQGTMIDFKIHSALWAAGL